MHRSASGKLSCTFTEIDVIDLDCKLILLVCTTAVTISRVSLCRAVIGLNVRLSCDLASLLRRQRS